MRRSTNIVLCFFAVVAGALAVLLSFDPLGRPSMFDPATWEYMSLAFLDGRVPYRDIFLHKTPGAAYAGLLGASVAETLGYPPLVGVRTVFLGLGALGPALLFLLCVRAGSSLSVGLLAAAWMLTFDPWTLGAIEGARPKIATTVFGLASLAASPRRPFLAGMFGSFSILCWQPGAVFLIASFLSLRRNNGLRGAAHDRNRSNARFVAGAIAPVAVLIAHLAANGALRDFIAQAFLFNAHYVERGARGPHETLIRLGSLLLQWSRPELLCAPVALAGLVWTRTWPPRGLTVATVGYLALTFISLQAWPDIILVGPGLAALLATGLTAPFSGMVLGPALRTGLVAAVLTLALFPGSGRFQPPISFAEQRDQIAGLAAGLQATDQVYVVSCPEFLIHTRRHSVLPWPYMWFGVDRFAAGGTEEGFRNILLRLERADPALMLVCRRWNGALRRQFEQWAAARYTREEVHSYPHTKRPMVVYRRRPTPSTNL